MAVRSEGLKEAVLRHVLAAFWTTLVCYLALVGHLIYIQMVKRANSSINTRDRFTRVCSGTRSRANNAVHAESVARSRRSTLHSEVPQDPRLR